MKKKIVIMGAGPAGLTLAYSILKENKDYSVVLIEECKDVGGISKTVKYSGNYMDLGGHRFFTKNEEVMELWKELLKPQSKKSFDDKMLKRDSILEKGGKDPEKYDDVLLIRRRLSRIYFNGHLIDYPVSLNMNTLKSIGFFGALEAGFSYLKSCIFKRKEESLEDFYINRFGYKLYSLFFKDYTEKVWGRAPSLISADWGRQRVKGLSIRKVLKNAVDSKLGIKEKEKETSLIEYFYYPKYGPGEMWNKMLDEVKNKGGKIIKNAKVNYINLNNNKIEYIKYIKDGKEIKEDGDIFISTLPIKDLINMFNKKPKNILSIANNLPYRDFITVGLVVKNINLKNQTDYKTFRDVTPDTWIYIQDKNYKLGRIQIFNNWSPYLVKDDINTVSLGLEYFCQEGDDFWNKSDKELIDFAISELLKMGLIDKKDIVNKHIERVRKAYPAYFDSYKDIDKVEKYLNSIDNLYCIGRNGQHRYNNMDHSMLTAIRCKDVILYNKNKEDIWNVNTEDKYLEGKDE